MPHDLINDVLDSGFFLRAEVVPAFGNTLDLIFQKLHEIAVLVCGHERHRPHESMPTLPSLCEVIRQTGQTLVELLGGLVDGVRGRI